MDFLKNTYAKLESSKVTYYLIGLLIFLLPFERIPSLRVMVGGTDVTVRLSQLVALVLIAVSIPRIAKLLASKPTLPKLFLPAFLFSYLLSTLMANDLKRAAMVFIFTLFVSLAALALAADLELGDLRRYEKILLLSTVVVLAVGFYQYFGDVFGLAPAVTGLRDIYTKSVFGFPRIQSTSLEPLYYGNFLLIPLMLLLAKRLVKGASVWPSLLFVTIVVQLALTVSRGAIIGGALAAIVLIGGLLIRKQTSVKRVALSLLMIAVGVGLAVAMTNVSVRKVTDKKFSGEQKTQKLIEQSTNLDSQDDRVRNRKLAVAAVKTRPLFGIGPGNFTHYAVQQYPGYSKVAPVIVNNEPLELLAEGGIVGFGLFVLFVAGTWFAVAKQWLKSQTKKGALSYWTPALLALFVGFAVQYQTFSTLYIMHIWVAIGLLMSFSLAKVNQTS